MVRIGVLLFRLTMWAAGTAAQPVSETSDHAAARNAWVQAANLQMAADFVTVLTGGAVSVPALGAATAGQIAARLLDADLAAASQPPSRERPGRRSSRSPAEATQRC